MLPSPAGREASSSAGALGYERHRPERTLLCQLAEEHYSALKAQLAAQSTELPVFVERPDGSVRFRWVKALTSAELTIRTSNNNHRAAVTPAKRSKGTKRPATADSAEQTPGERRASISWAQRLKRVFGIDVETCRACGRALEIIASRTLRL